MWHMARKCYNILDSNWQFSTYYRIFFNLFISSSLPNITKCNTAIQSLLNRWKLFQLLFQRLDYNSRILDCKCCLWMAHKEQENKIQNDVHPYAASQTLSLRCRHRVINISLINSKWPFEASQNYCFVAGTGLNFASVSVVFHLALV